jgi:hypothetical protein
VPSVLFGVGLPDENAHAPDGKLDLGNFHNGDHRVGVSLQRDREHVIRSFAGVALRRPGA